MLSDYKKFEIQVARHFSDIGYDVTRNKTIEGMEIDVFAKKLDSATLVIECKSFAKLLGMKTARQVVSQVLFLRSINQKFEFWLVTLNGLTPRAGEFLEGKSIKHTTLEELEIKLEHSVSSNLAIKADEFLSPESVVSKKIFVAMPFKSEMDDAFYFGYQWAANELGAKVKRLDKDWHSGEIIESLYAELDTADIIIADTTYGNANVLYELGYATAQKKPIILTCRSGTELPFDIKGRNHIFYENVNALRAPLLSALEILLEKA